MKIKIIVASILLVAAAGCTKPLAGARMAGEVEYVSRDFAAVPNDIYYAVRWALGEGGYPVAKEDLQNGIVTSSWLPVKSDSHYAGTFGRRDLGVTNSYYQIEVQVIPGEGRTSVKVGSRVKTLVAGLKSSGGEERKVLDRIGDCLRKNEPNVTNLGIDE